MLTFWLDGTLFSFHNHLILFPSLPERVIPQTRSCHCMPVLSTIHPWKTFTIFLLRYIKERNKKNTSSDKKAPTKLKTMVGKKSTLQKLQVVRKAKKKKKKKKRKDKSKKEAKTWNTPFKSLMHTGEMPPRGVPNFYSWEMGSKSFCQRTTCPRYIRNLIASSSWT